MRDHRRSSRNCFAYWVFYTLIKVDKVCVNTFAFCVASKMIDYIFIILDHFARGLCCCPGSSWQGHSEFNWALYSCSCCIFMWLLAFPVISWGCNIWDNEISLQSAYTEYPSQAELNLTLVPCVKISKAVTLRKTLCFV